MGLEKDRCSKFKYGLGEKQSKCPWQHFKFSCTVRNFFGFI